MKQKVKEIFIKLKLIHLYRGLKYCFHRILYLPKNIPYRLRGAKDGLPTPPPYLIYLTINKPSLFDYFKGGFITSSSIERLLAKNNINPEEFENILDFGSGCGRVIRDFSNLKKTELYGSDYNPKLVKWCQKNLYCANFSQNHLEPPLKFEDQKFDFIYLISVFTHLPRKTQINWLNEFHRVIKKDKYLLITLHGDHIAKELTKEEKDLFSKQGYVERGLDKPGSNHFGTFHSKQHFKEMLKGKFKILDISYGGKPNHPYQDLYLLEKI